MRRGGRDHAGVRGHFIARPCPHDQAVRREGHPRNRGGRVDRAGEAPRQGQRNPVVAVGEAVAREVAETGRAVGERGGVLILELVAGRDGEPGGDRGAGALRRDEPPFTQAEPARERPLAHLHVMVLRAGEMMQRENKLFVGHDPQIRR